MKYKFFIFSFLILLAIFVVFLGRVEAAEERELEVSYPEMLGFKISKISTPFPDYVKYIYYLILGISGFVALGVLTVAGFQYLTSAGSPEKMIDAKDRIKAAILGLLILFLSVLILRTISFQLASTTLTPILPSVAEITPGVFLCKKQVDVKRAWSLTNEFNTADFARKEDIRKELNLLLEEISLNCVITSNISKIDGDYTYSYLVPGRTQKYETREYGAIFFDEENFKGKPLILYPDFWQFAQPYEFSVGNILPRSALVFYINPAGASSGEIVLYDKPNYNRDYSDAQSQTYNIGAGAQAGFYADFSLPTSPSSIEIKGDLIAILAKEEGNYDVFIKSDSNLLDNNEIVEESRCWLISSCANPAANRLVIISGKLY